MGIKLKVSAHSTLKIVHIVFFNIINLRYQVNFVT